MSRASLWQDIDQPRHFALIDDALDVNDDEHRQIRKTAAEIEARLVAKMEAGFSRCEQDSDGLRKLLVGLLVAIVTASITIVGTVLITAGGGS